jgi:hypothetical protein
LGASVAGWLIGAVAALLLCSTWVDANALFPAVSSSATWSADGGSFVEPFAGLRVLPQGSFRTLETVRPKPTGIGPGPLDALLAVAPLAAILPIWVVAPLTPWARAAVAALAGALLILLLHLVAGGQAPAIALVVATVPLALQTIFAAVAGGRPCPIIAVRGP